MPTTPDDAADLARRFFDALARKDAGAVAELLDPDTRIVLPLSLDGGQEPAFAAEGREAVMGYWAGAFQRFSRLQLLDRRITPAADGGTVFVEARGDFEGAPGQSYRNVYVWRLDVAAGLVTHTAEYANPVTFVNAFGDATG